MSIDYTAARTRVAQAGEALDADVSPILALSDEQMNETGEAIELIARLLPGQSLDWIFFGNVAPMIRAAGAAATFRAAHEAANPDTPADRLMTMTEYRSPLQEARALARMMDGAGRGELLDMVWGGDTVGTVADMIADRVVAAMIEIEAIRTDMTGGGCAR